MTKVCNKIKIDKSYSVAVHTIETSGDKTPKSTISKLDANNQVKASRKFFSATIALKMSAYEEWRMDNGHEVGGWVTSCPKDIREAIRAESNKPIKRDITYRDNSIERIYVKPENYGHLVDGKVEITPHQKRWIRVFNCSTRIQKLIDQRNPENVFYADKHHDCNDKMCIGCARKKSYIALMKHRCGIAEMDNPVMLVLHTRNPKEGELSNCLDKMAADMTTIRKTNNQRAKRKQAERWTYFWSNEITFNQKARSYHPHYHIIIEQRNAKEFLNRWIELDPENRTHYAHKDAISKPLKGQKDKQGKVIPLENQIIEMFKYAAKISTTDIDQNGNPTKGKLAPIEMIYEMCMATYKRRRWGACGDLYNRVSTKQVKETIKRDIAEKVKEDGFNSNDNPILELSPTWVFDYKKSDFIGLCEDVEMRLTGYEPTDRTKEFLGITNDLFSHPPPREIKRLQKKEIISKIQPDKLDGFSDVEMEFTEEAIRAKERAEPERERIRRQRQKILDEFLL